MVGGVTSRAKRNLYHAVTSLAKEFDGVGQPGYEAHVLEPTTFQRSLPATSQT